jgi:ABC-type Fe3+ transport system substrate-binding protein
MGRRAVLQAGLGLAAAPAVAQVGQGITSALVTAAQAEGAINYYHNSDIDPTTQWTAAFSKQYGIGMKNMRQPSFPLFDRWLNEERVGRHIADLIQITDPTLLSLAHRQGFVANHVPAGDARIPAEFKESGVWYGLFTIAMGIGYNSQKVSSEEETFLRTGGWNVLADPRWKGRFGTCTPASGGSSYAYCFMFLVTLRQQYGPEWFRKLAANKPDIYASKPPLFERLAAGEYALMDQGSDDTLSVMYLRGAPVRWVYPEPTPVAMTAQSISSHAPHPNAARLFQEWCVTPEGQQEWVKYVFSGMTHPDAVDPRRVARKDWFGEPWYHVPTRIYTDYLTDPRFADPKKPVIAEWNDIFGYQGGRGG